MKVLVSILFSATFMLAGCSGAHLDIFPSLDDPGLMNEKIAPELLHADIDALLNGVEHRHPDFAGYADKPILNRLRTKLKADISRPLTRVEFFRVVGQLSHAFGDGHSFLLWPYQELRALQEQGAKTFPISVKYSADGLYLTQSYQSGNQQFASGSQLIRINGVAVPDILEHTQLYVGGETAALRKAFVADRLPFMLWAVYGFIDRFDVELLHQGQVKHLSIDRNQQWQIAGKEPDQQNTLLSYTQLEQGIGYLNVPTFDVDPDDFSFQLQNIFRQIVTDSPSALIIDLRSNTGGNTDTAAALAAYLADKPFRLVSQMSERLNDDNRGWFGYKGKSGQLIKTQWQENITPVTASQRYNGKVVLLVGPLTYSAAIVFATTIQDYQFGLLAGEPTGGYANQSGQGNLFNLPNSQLRAYVATRLLLRPSGDPRVQTVHPDLAISENKSDRQNGIDTTLQQVIKQLHAGRFQANRK